MIIRISAALCVATVAVVAVSGAFAQTPAWAPGTWKGALQSYDPRDKNGPDRVLVISKDGKCTWDVVTAAKPTNAPCTLTANGLSLTTGAQTQVDLSLKGNTLSGTFSLAKGRAYSITMTKQ
jgi:hypothetical protein